MRGEHSSHGQFTCTGACSNSYLNTTISAPVGKIQSKLLEKGAGGGEDLNIMHFFLFLRSGGDILHTLGHKVHKFMGILSTA